MEQQQHNDTNKIPARNSTESKSRFKDVDMKTSRSSSRKTVSTKRKMPLNAESMIETSLVKLKHSESVIDRNDDDDGFKGAATSCDVSSRGKTAKKTDHVKSEKVKQA